MRPFFLFVWFLFPGLVWADYAQELQDQIKDIKAHAAQHFEINYFHDMGIVARKADDAELTNLTAEVADALLLKQMETYVTGEIKGINELYRTDSIAATHRLEDLNRFETFYEPSEEFLNTTTGQALAGELARLRQTMLSDLKKDCSMKKIIEGIQAIRKTGLFRTGRPEEILSLRDLGLELDCCLAWKAKVNYRQEKTFKTDYDAGTVTEEMHLALQSSARDYSEARWVGEWIYHFHGREGTADGLSQVSLRYRKGDETARLVVSASKMSSVGRMNLPMSTSGEDRTIEVKGESISPEAVFSTSSSVTLTGCRENKI